MTMLLLSLGALALGPLLYRLSPAGGGFRAGLDGFAFVAMSGLILIHVIPEGVELSGAWALVAVVIGLFGPLLFERTVQRAGRQAHGVALVIGVLGILVHSITDGIAVYGLSPDGVAETDHALALAVIVHRLPAGMTVWWLLRQQFGRAIAVAALVAMSIATVIGFLFAEPLSHVTSDLVAGLFLALVGGSLLHVVLHPAIEIRDGGGRLRFAPGIGAVLGLALLFAIPSDAGHAHGSPDAGVHAGDHDHDHADDHAASPPAGAVARSGGFSALFLGLALASAPALLLAYLLAGLVQVFLPKATVRWMGRGRAVGQALRGVAFGLPLPICSCGVVPIYESLVRQGAPATAAMAFLVATPELGLDAILISWPLLGGPMTVVRVIGAAVVALLVGYLVGRRVIRHTPSAATLTDEQEQRPVGVRLREAARLGAVDLFDSTAPWILLGLAVAALVEPVLALESFARIPRVAQVPLFALIGLPVYVCAAAATPVVAVLVFAGVSPGAALAFLLTGPATNVTTYGILSSLHGRRVAIAFAAVMIVGPVLLGWGVNAFLPPITPIDVMAHAHASWGPVAWTSLAILAALVIASIVRQGPRQFVSPVAPWAARTGNHDHGACHGEVASENVEPPAPSRCH